MKKIISAALVAILLVTVLVLPTSAASTNAKVTIQYIDKAPVIDGVVNVGEYGPFKVHSVDYSNDEFIAQFDPEKRIKADFYMTWDIDYLYMAWVVHTDIHVTMDGTKDYNGDGKVDETDLMYMWEYCCVQFIITPGEPKLGTSTFQPTGQMYGDFLEVGLAIIDGESRKTAWCKPNNGQGLGPDDWDFAGQRNETAKTTTYEIRLPWEKTGITKIGNDKKFGLSYAIGDQVDFTNVGPGMVEWQDAILGGKNADAAGVIILAGYDGEDIEVSVVDGTESLDPVDTDLIPEVATTMLIDGVNKAIINGSSAIITKVDETNLYNLKYSYNILARPVSGKANTYSIISASTGPGTEHPTFEGSQTGDIVIAFHTDGTAGKDRVDLAKQLEIGEEIVLLGIDVANGKLSHSGALIYVERELDGAPVDESSDDVTSDPGTETSDPGTESSEDATSSEAPKTESSKGETPEGDNTALIVILIIVGVLVVGGGVYFFVIRKKK